MASTSGVQERLARAGNLPEFLDAAYDAFEEMHVVIRQHDDPSTGFFVPMVMAGASAANGRDAILWAPSLPMRRLHPERQTGNGQRPVTAQAAASWLLSLCEVLAGRLAETAESAAEPGDRDACLHAARHAREIHGLMGGGRT